MRKERPNIIVIMADDMGHGDINGYGNPIAITPNLDSMIKNGISLMQHYSASPMCAPARAAFLTGKYPHRTGAIDVSTGRGLDRIAETEHLISEAFKKNGYKTGLIGKWHNGRDSKKYHPMKRGFDEFIGFDVGICDYWDWKIEKNGKNLSADGRYLTDVLTDEASDFIKRNADEPFFLMVAYNAPHTPLQAHKDDIEIFKKTGKFNSAVSTIHAMIKRMDEGIGVIRDTVSKAGLEANTIILFTSDNGPCFRGEGENCQKRFNIGLSGMKGFTLEGGIRVPAIITAPWVESGQRIYDVFHFTDWYITLLSLAGISKNDIKNLDGRDLSNLLKDGKTQEKKYLFWQWNRLSPVRKCNAAARLGKYKLYYEPIPEAVEYPISELGPLRKRLEKPWEFHLINTNDYHRQLSSPAKPLLFNVESDPGETTDIAEDYPEIYIDLVNRIDDWFEQCLDEWALKSKLTLGDAARVYRPDK